MADEEIQNEQQNDRFRLIKIPKQNYKAGPITPKLSKSTVEELREVFDLFSNTDQVNPYHIRNGLRSVGKD